MNARYWQRGETLDYTAEEAVVNGQVVSLGNRIGVAGNDIAEGATGALHVTGVYIMDKKASEKITMAPRCTMTPRRTKLPPPKRAMSPPATQPQRRRPATPPFW